MLIECCKFGKVIRLVSPEGALFDSLGCIAVTFENMASARECSSSLHGRWFDSRQIETKVFSPPTTAPSNLNLNLNFNSTPSCPSSSSSSSSSSLLHYRDNVPNSDYTESAGVPINNYDTNNCNITNNTLAVNDPNHPQRDAIDGTGRHPPNHQHGNNVTAFKHFNVEVTTLEPDVDDFLNSFL